MRSPALALATLFALTACGEKQLNEAPPDAAVTDDAAVEDDAAVVTDGGEAPPLTPYPGGCADDAECADLCRLGICVSPPRDQFQVAYGCQDMPLPQARPNLACFDAPPALADGPAMVPARGKVEFFGDGELTVGLTVRVYLYKDFNPTPCMEAAGAEQNVIAARQLIEACVDTLGEPLAETVTVPCNPPDPESGCYALDALPTGQRLVIRITGDLDEWVPTYQYGVFINPCSVPVVREELGACPEDYEVEGEIDWGCDLTADPAGDYYQRNFSVISQATWISFPATAGLNDINIGNGAVAGRFFDCEGRYIINATFALAQQGSVTTYFNGNPDDLLPLMGQTQTNNLGTYASLNVPAGPNGLVAVAVRGANVPTVAFERFFLLPNTVTLINPSGREALEEEPPY